MQDLELVEAGADRLGALEVQHGREPVAVEVVDAARDPQPPAGGALHPLQQRDLGERLAQRALVGHGREVGARSS